MLPQPTLASAEFWTSGADGVLRIAQCDACGRRAHPKPPVCRHCGADSLAMTATDGLATVVGFTVNSQQWLPRFPPPYVVAIVALASDPAARLTTNIVNCAAADVSIGMPVRVVFEHADDDIWIPLFEPDPDRPGTVVEVPDPASTHVYLRPMASSTKFEDKVAITGVGQSQIGRRLMVDPLSLTVAACRAAIDDAGLTFADIDGLSTYPGMAPAGMSEGGVMALEDTLGIHPTWVNGGGELPGQNGSIIAAMLAVASGLCRHVLCFRTVWESTHSALTRSGQWRLADQRATGMLEDRAPYGAMSAANWIACQASQYLHRYGVDRETLGWIAVNARTNASANPEAVYRDPITIDDYLSARMVSSPFGLYDCDIPCDGSVAVIVSAVETTKDLPGQAIRVEAVGTQITERLSWDQGTLTHLPQSLGPSAHLWSRTELTTDDVDVAMLYDGFTFNALSWLEGLGFCEFGGAADFIDRGAGIAVGSALPVNPHGGQLSAGRTHGYGHFREAVLQLRGQAPGRQVDDAQVAVVTAGGGVPSGAILLRRP
ncbi:OB-fold domain-containing protein [Gordonia alkanivorans]|nr:OB-fold domain-containing protein [Gordonia alkanivorans]MDH3047219.1 OB-fold domain-containing protein [Gordonia alkanivorans]